MAEYASFNRLRGPVLLFAAFRFRAEPVTALSSGYPLGIPLGPTSGMECFWDTGVITLLSICKALMRNFLLFSFPVFPEAISETLISSISSASKLNHLKNDWRFFRLTELLRTSPFVQPPTLLMCRPESLNDPVVCSAKNLSPSPHLQRDLLLLT